MRYLLLIVVAAVMLGASGCWMFPPNTDEETRRFFGGNATPREALDMEVKPTAAPNGDQPSIGNPDRTHGGVR
jgi:hypothetical protein